MLLRAYYLNCLTFPSYNSERLSDSNLKFLITWGSKSRSYLNLSTCLAFILLTSLGHEPTKVAYNQYNTRPSHAEINNE